MSKNEKNDTKDNKAIDDLKVMGPESGIDLNNAMAQIESAFLMTYMNEPFLGGVGSNTTKRPDPKVATAYVGVDPKTLEIYMGFNPYWMGSLPQEHRMGVIQHEYYHVCLSHLTGRMPANGQHRRLMNIATDLAINCFIGENKLPDFALMPGKAPKYCSDQDLSDLIKSFPKEQEAEFYFDALLKLVEKKQQGKGPGEEFTFELGNEDGEGTLDGHGHWGDVPEELRDVLRDQIEGLIRNSIQRAEEKGQWGNMPSALQEMFKKLLTREVNWRDIVRQFLGIARTMQRMSTIKRLNKKVPYLFPGSKRKNTARFLFAIDQSGSMSDGEVIKGLSEVFSLSQEAEIDTINFDTEVDESSFKTWKRGKQHPWVRTRCGGTDFECVQRYANDPKNRGKWSGIIIYTDGYAAGMGQIVGAKVLWLITEGGTQAPVRPGDLVVQMKANKKSSTNS